MLHVPLISNRAIFEVINFVQSIKKHTVQNIAVGVSLKATLARPKSQILSLQSAFANIFLGFRSR